MNKFLFFYSCSKYYKEMKQAGVHASKHIYMSLIRAYASCRQFEKAKQVGMRIICSFKRSLMIIFINYCKSAIFVLTLGAHGSSSTD